MSRRIIAKLEVNSIALLKSQQTFFNRVSSTTGYYKNSVEKSVEKSVEISTKLDLQNANHEDQVHHVAVGRQVWQLPPPRHFLREKLSATLLQNAGAQRGRA